MDKFLNGFRIAVIFTAAGTMAYAAVQQCLQTKQLNRLADLDQAIAGLEKKEV